MGKIELALFMRRDNVVKIPGVVDAETGDPDDSLEMSLRVLDRVTETLIDDGAATMVNIDEGVYQGAIDASCNFEGLSPDDDGIRYCWLVIDEASLLHARKILCEVYFEGWKDDERTIFTGQTNYFQLTDVYFPDGSGFDSTLDLTFTLLDAIGGTAVANGSMPLSYTGSGVYGGTIPGDADTANDARYVGWVEDAVTGRCWAFKIAAKDRGKG